MAEADSGTNETKGVPDADRGVGRPFKIISTDGSQSKRKRAYHRALKRGETWAKLQASYKIIADRLAQDLYSQATAPNAFFGLIDREKMNKDMKQEGLPIPILSGLNAWLPKPIEDSADET